MRKLLATLLAITMLCGIVSAASAEWDGWNLEGTIFPLAEPMTFTVLTSGYRYANIADIVNNKDWQALEAATNVHIDFVFLGDYDAPEAKNNLQMRLLSNDYGDAIMSVYLDNLTAADIEELSAAGKLADLTPYVNDPSIMPYIYKNVTTENPEMLRGMRSSDGKIYALYGVSGLAIYTAGEALMQVNEKWLNAWKAARGVDHSPADLAEFEDMLTYFADNDMNGNGDNDEIAYFIAQNTYQGCATLEHAMGMFGIATKDSALDMDVMINDDGECFFVYTTDMYKAGLKTFADWYKKGLVWEEIFTGNAETITAVMAEAQNKVGVVNNCGEMEGFVTILPPAIEGYQARYHMHPGARKGTAGQPYGVITDKCEHPEILAAFMDLMYDMENSLAVRYGTSAWTNGQLSYNDEGKVVFNVPAMPENKGSSAIADEDRPIHDFVWYIQQETQQTADKYYDLDSLFGGQSRVAGAQMYIDNNIWNPTGNIWPRCPMLPEYADDYSFMYTDVSAVLAEYRAQFVTGKLDVDAEWDNFQNKLNGLGIEKMTKMVQASYDAYIK